MLPYILIFVGVLMIFPGVRLMIVKHRLKSDFIPINAFIVEVKKYRSDKGGVLYTPVVEYTAGEVYRKKLNYGTGKRMRIGDQIEIFYNPAKPHEIFKKGHYSEKEFGAIILIVLGLVFTIAGYFIWSSGLVFF